MSDPDQWYENPATKGDLYYIAYSLMAVFFALTALLTSLLGDNMTAIGLMLFAIASASASFATSKDGVNRYLWEEVLP